MKHAKKAAREAPPDPDGLDAEMLRAVCEAGVRSARYSLEQELRREDSAVAQSGWMVTGFSALSILVATATPAVFDLGVLPARYLAVVLCAFFLLSLASLFCATLVQFRPERRYPDSPSKVCGYFTGQADQFDMRGLADMEAALYQGPHEDLDRINARRMTFLKVAAVLFLIALAFLAVFVLVPLLVALALCGGRP